MKLSGFAVAWCLVPLLLACDSSSPTAPPPPTAMGEDQATVTIELQGIPSQIQVGQSQSFTVIVTSSESPLPTQVGISTTLGNFGSNASGPITQTTLALSNGQATATFFSGDTAGSASIAANVGSVTETLTVTITTAPALFIQQVIPTFGPATGGNTVEIVGQGFQGTPRVSFGGVVTQPATSVTATSIKVQAPPPETPVSPGSTLVVDVSVTLAPSGSDQAAVSDTLPAAYTYTPGDSPVAPVITSVSPSQGQNSGGTVVTITGAAFDSDVVVSLGMGSDANSFSGNQLSSVDVSGTDPTDSTKHTTIRFTTPAAVPAFLNQTLDILVRNPSSGLATVARSVFTYIATDSVVDIQPREASYTGKDPTTGNAINVTITAQGLAPISQSPLMPQIVVEFGGQFQTNCTPNSSDCTVSQDGDKTTLELGVRPASVTDCSPPSGAVMLTDQVTGETSTGPTFTYTAETPSLQSVTPSQGPAAGDSTTGLTLSGSFSTTEATTVLVNGVVADILSGPTADSVVVAIPAFTGTFDQVACGTNGMKNGDQKVDVEVLYPATGCNAVGSGVFTYQPADDTCVESTSPPLAGFSFSVSDLDVQFTDTSTGTITERLWTFGDGATAGNDAAPSHTYGAAGTYNVTLKVSNSAGSDSITQAVTVGTIPPLPVASFLFSAVGLTVSFMDTSSGNPTSWLWLFGDGNGSPQQNPTHVYSREGTFSVTLQVTNAAGTDSFTQNITVVPDPPIANFTFVFITPQQVLFNDASVGTVTSYLWEFGDGTTSTVSDPLHTYAAAGSFPVSLTVSNAGGSDTATQVVVVP